MLSIHLPSTCRFQSPDRISFPPVRPHNPQVLSLRNLRFSLTVSATSAHGNLTPRLPVGDSRESPKHLFCQLAVSAVLLIGLGIRGFPASASNQIPPCAISDSQEVIKEQSIPGNDGESSKDMVDFEDMELKDSFERWKTKTYALSVPLRVVSLQGSVPPLWVKDFLRSQGRRVRLRSEFRGRLEEIFSDLSMPYRKGKFNPKSAVAADAVTIGDSWLSFAIKKALIEPIDCEENQDWFRGLGDKWKVHLRRDSEGKLNSDGRIWAAPYRWGSMVIAYRKMEFQKHNLAPIKDWADLWQPELAGKVSMVDCPREVIGAVLKSMGASYNPKNLDDEVVGGRVAVQKHLAELGKQVRLFDSQHYLKAFGVGDVWVAVGWSSDVLPVVKRMRNVAVVVPMSGASLWSDLWAIPAASGFATDQIGGRVRGPSPLVHQWIEFCLQDQRALPFKQLAIPGASPSALENPTPDDESVHKVKGQPKLDTNLVAGVPPPEILASCEFLEPLPEAMLSDYQWLIASIKKPSHGVVRRLQHYLGLV